jgi:hypothetical protein
MLVNRRTLIPSALAVWIFEGVLRTFLHSMNFVYDGKPELGECGLAVVSVVERLIIPIFYSSTSKVVPDPPNSAEYTLYPLFPSGWRETLMNYSVVLPTRDTCLTP